MINKLIIFSTSVLVVFSAKPASTDEIPEIMSWEEWQQIFEPNRAFAVDGFLLDERRMNFDANIERIKKQNLLHDQGKSTYRFGVNQFADLSQKQFADVVGLGNDMRDKRRRTRKPVKFMNETIPTSVDWRTEGAVTEVKNQGQCGSCWSFSATGSMEGAVFKGSGQLVSLSEKQLVDCSTSNSGCNGGLMDYAFEYVINNKGIDTEADYPYQPEQGICDKSKESKHSATITGYEDVTPNNVQALMEAISIVPTSVAIEADTEVFQLYSTGVLNSAACGTSLDHGVLAVGYTEENDADFPNAFIVKNSWGRTWGASGYVYLSRDTSQSGRKGVCGILEQPSYATGGSVGPAPGPSPTPKPGSNDYENPFLVPDCRDGEFNITLPYDDEGHSYCAPVCTKDPNSCPTAPSSFSSNIQVRCNVFDAMTKMHFCSLGCTYSDDCGDGAECTYYCTTTSCVNVCAYRQGRTEKKTKKRDNVIRPKKQKKHFIKDMAKRLIASVKNKNV